MQETDLDATLAANRARIRATLDVGEAVRDSTITFVIVPTPSDARGAFAFDAAARAFEAIGTALRDKNAYHLVVLTSTVLPGHDAAGAAAGPRARLGQTRRPPTSDSATARSSSPSAASSATSSTRTSR